MLTQEQAEARGLGAARGIFFALLIVLSFAALAGLVLWAIL